MTNKLEVMFRSYAKAVQLKLQKEMKKQRAKEPLSLFTNKTMELRALVDELENEAEFRQLVVETRSAFLGGYHGKTESAWRQAVENFFRRSEYYSDIFEKRHVSIDETFQGYREAFKRREIQITYFAPMEFVYFNDQRMDFGGFQIRRFSADELKRVFQNRVNEIFYPRAVIDVKRLQNYWFIQIKEVATAPKLGFIYLPLGEIGRVTFEYTRYTRYSKAIEFAIQQLALFDWQADLWRDPSANAHIQKEEDLERGWLGFNIPFVLTVDNNLLGFPRGMPHLSKLQTEPDIDILTGEETGERPVVYIHLNKDETKSFKAFMQHTGKLLATLQVKENGWQFLEVARGYFIKAFFAEGLEQMLWHITTLEALLGEKGEGITARLARRIASILGKTQDERKTVRKQFKELYDFRCDLVHGNPFPQQAYEGHLRNARNLARRTILWFFHYLSEIKGAIPNDKPGESIPTREDILILLDMDPNSRMRIGGLINNLPERFPYVREWIE